ncbi:BlaI/MecI/CopY family transcriptional regulator [Roseiconus nitratireducens]|uniref:BlaI/MecI/CopY family transcriptional regulator n=1 Tax=Roseiconus nitratireducens TaxID=2605748 RepID=A0A5M6D5C3_9BACT|nr:BlaI/MecI/CopY family transcriptional regulator [Roseiconus nitratireducens]KAA5542708.1 BlaI/MecI/CopY family transcriptional regulator [Roseiconus nitratireducens]
MTNFEKLSRRERQIMEIVYEIEQATVHQIRKQLDGDPTPMAVRRLLAILMEKGYLKRVKSGREFAYLPKQPKTKAGVKALRKVVKTFFEGSIGEALATHLERPGASLSSEEVERLSRLIDEFKKEQNKRRKP